MNGERCGKGIYYFGDGRLWEGEWLNNLQNGEGFYQNKDGSIIKGEWKMGEKM
jgi:hypothetical protein